MNGINGTQQHWAYSSNEVRFRHNSRFAARLESIFTTKPRRHEPRVSRLRLRVVNTYFPIFASTRARKTSHSCHDSQANSL